MIGIVYRTGIYHKPSEKLGTSGYFTYPVWQRSSCGQSVQIIEVALHTALDIIISSVLTACMNVIVDMHSTVCGLWMHLARSLCLLH